jgi:predicted transcriptional regulator
MMIDNMTESLSNEASVNASDKPYLSIVIPESERIISSRFNYRIKIKDEVGRWLDEIILPDDTGSVAKLHSKRFFTGNNDIDDTIESLLLWSFRHYSTKTLFQLESVLESFQGYYLQSRDINKALENLFTRQALEQQGISFVRRLIMFLIAYETEGLSSELAQGLINTEVANRQNAYFRLYTMCDEAGPFTREELAHINQALHNTEAPLDSRIVMWLYRDFGFRPIQLCLLKEKDFIRDSSTGAAWLNVPRVKQKHQWRRTEFTKRVLSPDLADAIEEMIDSNRQYVTLFEQDEPPLFQRRWEAGRLYQDQWIKNPYDHLYEGDKKDFAMHVSSNALDLRLKQMKNWLGLSPRTGAPFSLNAYRFRYTVGTNAVLEGYTEPEVAELLDHSCLGSVKHYFKNTRELWELLEKATEKRVEQKHFASAWIRQDAEKDNIYGQNIIELTAFTSVGKCHKGSTCHLEPAVACYSCDQFCPSKNTSAHVNAKTYIEEQRALLREKTTGQMAHQLDEALAGCDAAIAYSEGVYVVDLNNTKFYQPSFGNDVTFEPTYLEDFLDE